MHNISKFLLVSLLVVVACFFYACTSDSPEGISPDNHQEVKFVTADVSRAVTSSINYYGSKFALFGDMKYATGSPVEVFRNVEVEYDGAAWNYSGTQYWYPNHEHSFVAIHPAEVFINTAEPRYSESKLTFDYALPLAGDATLDTGGIHDLLVATHRRLYSGGGDGTVSLGFGHLMSIINFAPAFVDNLLSDDDYMLIHKLQLSKIATKARFEISPAPLQSGSQTDDMMIDIATQETGSPIIELGDPVMVKNHADNINLFALADVPIMLPQSFAADSEAKIVFYCSLNDETELWQVELPLNTQHWESSKSYTYKFTIERTGLRLDNCEIAPWNEIRGDEITVD